MHAPTQLQPLVDAAHSAYIWTKKAFVEVFNSFCSLFTEPPSTCTAMVVYTGPASSPRTKRKAQNSRSIYDVIRHNSRVYLRRVCAHLKRLSAQRAYHRALEGARKSQAGLKAKAAKATVTKASFTRPLARTFFPAAMFARLTPTGGVGAGFSPYSPGLSGPLSATTMQPLMTPKSPLARLVTSIATPMRSFYISAVNSIGSSGRWSVLPFAPAFGTQTAETSRSIPRSPVSPPAKNNNQKNVFLGSPGSLGPLSTALPHSMVVHMAAITKKRTASAVPTARPSTSLVMTMGSPVA